MAEFPYAAVPSKLESLLEKIKTVGIPDKATKAWLHSIGFKSSNDPSMLPVVEFIGLVDSSRLPTSRWNEFRQKNKSKNVLADAIKRGYSSLYDTHENAHFCNDEELKDFFKAHSTAGDQAITRTTKTFQVLCSLADFIALTDNGADTGENGNGASLGTGVPLVVPPQNIESPTPTLHIDFQVHIAADAPPEQIDQIFESMAKHLYGKDAD